MVTPEQIEAAKALDNILTYHETGGHKGDGSDHALREARRGLESILAALKAQQPDEEMVERVARALCAADPEVRHGDAEGVVQQRVHIEWHRYAHAARAAIAAMQESRDDTA